VKRRNGTLNFGIKPLLEHLLDFENALVARGNSEIHVEVVTARARRIIKGCGFKFYADITPSRVMDFLSELRKDTTNKRGISAQTFNFHLGAFKQFCKWMVKDRRATETAVAHLDGLNVRIDRRRDRRALAVGELTRLLETTRNGAVRCGMTGQARAVLYLVALETGLRSNELRSLTRGSFDLTTCPATVTVQANYSKRRRQDTLILREEVVAELRPILANLTPQMQVFRIPADRKAAAALFRADVEAAGIAYRDDSGRVADFHALRHTFISNLAAGGVHPKTAQPLARHSTITLTMDRYTHSLHQDNLQALETLPNLANPGAGGKINGRNATRNAR